MSQLTTGAGEGRGAIHDSFHRKRGHSLEKSSMLKMLKMSLGRADPRGHCENKTIDQLMRELYK